MLARSQRNELTSGTGLGVNREKPVEARARRT